MIFLDAKKYQSGGFEELYFTNVYDALTRMQGGKKEGSWKKDSSDKWCIPRELVKCLKSAGILGLFLENASDADSLNITSCDKAVLERILKKLILADVETLREACENLDPYKGKTGDFLEYFYENAYASMCRTEVPDLWNGEEKVSLPVRMVEQLDLRTCPYCNRNYIGISKGKNLGVQLDHFFSKSGYPYFAVSLYNLIPSCGVCNNVKRAEDSKGMISPFTEEKGSDGVTFHLGWDGKTESLFVVPGDAEHGKNMEAFHLKTAYAFHQAEARRFREKLTAYPPSMLDEIARMLAGEEAGVKKEQIRQDLEMSLFGDYFTEPDQYNKKPLSKLHRDLYYEFRGWK